MAAPKQMSDEEMARDLQRQEVLAAATPVPVQPTVQPVAAGTPVGQPVYYGGTQPGQPGQPGQPAAVPIYGTATYGGPAVLSVQEERLLQTYSLGRGIKCLAIIDLFFLILFAISFPYLLLLLFAPAAGYYGAQTYQRPYIMCYFLLYCCRLVFDVTLLFYGYWWFLFDALVSLLIMRFVYLFYQLLGEASEQELDQLRNPTPVIVESRRYFYVF